MVTSHKQSRGWSRQPYLVDVRETLAFEVENGQCLASKVDGLHGLPVSHGSGGSLASGIKKLR